MFKLLFYSAATIQLAFPLEIWAHTSLWYRVSVFFTTLLLVTSFGCTATACIRAASTKNLIHRG